jgi:hypothetical protein
LDEQRGLLALQLLLEGNSVRSAERITAFTATRLSGCYWKLANAAICAHRRVQRFADLQMTYRSAAPPRDSVQTRRSRDAP